MINKRSLLQAFVSLLIISSLFVENLWTLAQPSGLVSIRRSFARKMGNEKEVLKVFAVLQEIHGNRVRDEANSETNAIRGRNLFLFYSALLALKTNLEEPPYSLTGGTSLMQYIELYLHHLQTDGWGLFNSREYPIDLIVEWQKKLLVMAKRVPYLTRDAFISLVRWIYEATAPLGEVPKEYDLAWADVKDLMLTPNNISHPVKINGSVPNSPDFKKDVSKFLLLLDAETPHSYEYQTLFDIAVQKDTDKDDRLTQKALALLLLRSRDHEEHSLTVEEAKLLIKIPMHQKALPLFLDMSEFLRETPPSLTLENTLEELSAYAFKEELSSFTLENTLEELCTYAFNVVMRDLSDSLTPISDKSLETFDHLLLISHQGYSDNHFSSFSGMNEATQSFDSWYKKSPKTLLYFLRKCMETPARTLENLDEAGENEMGKLREEWSSEREKWRLRKELAEKLIEKINIKELAMHNPMTAVIPPLTHEEGSGFATETVTADPVVSHQRGFRVRSIDKDLFERLEEIEKLNLNSPRIRGAIQAELFDYFYIVAGEYGDARAFSEGYILSKIAELISKIEEKDSQGLVPLVHKKLARNVMDDLLKHTTPREEDGRLLDTINSLIVSVYFLEDLEEEKEELEKWLTRWNISLLSPGRMCCGGREKRRVLTSHLKPPKINRWDPVSKIFPNKELVLILARQLALFYKDFGRGYLLDHQYRRKNVSLVEKTPVLIPEENVLYHGYYLHQDRDDKITTTVKPFLETPSGEFYIPSEGGDLLESQTIYLADGEREITYQEAIDGFLSRLSVKINALDPARHPLQVAYLKILIKAITSGEYHINIVKYNRYAAHNTRMHIQHPIDGQPGRITIKEEALLREDDNDIDLFAFLWEASRIAEPDLDYLDRFKKVSELAATMIIEKGEEITAGYARLAKVAHLLTGSEEDQPFVDIKKTVPVGTEDKLILTEVPNIADIFDNLATGNPVKLTEQLRTFKHVVDTYA